MEGPILSAQGGADNYSDMEPAEKVLGFAEKHEKKVIPIVPAERRALCI